MFVKIDFEVPKASTYANYPFKEIFSKGSQRIDQDIIAFHATYGVFNDHSFA